MRASPRLELEDQVVTRRAVDGPRRRARELRDPVLTVHHVTTYGEIIEESVDVARPGARDAVHDPTSGEVALTPDHELGHVDGEARRQRALEHAQTHLEHLGGIRRHF